MVTATPVKSTALPPSKLLVELSDPVTYVTYVKRAGDGGRTEYSTETNRTRYVVVSVTELLLDRPETAIFPADAEGNVLDWAELACIGGVADFGVAIRAAGWKLLDA